MLGDSPFLNSEPAPGLAGLKKEADSVFNERNFLDASLDDLERDLRFDAYSSTLPSSLLKHEFTGQQHRNVAKDEVSNEVTACAACIQRCFVARCADAASSTGNLASRLLIAF